MHTHSPQLAFETNPYSVSDEDSNKTCIGFEPVHLIPSVNLHRQIVAAWLVGLVQHF